MEEENFVNDYKDINGVNYGLKGRKAMANVQAGDEIVITGISGAFPSSSNVHEYRNNLFNKVDTVLPNRRWDVVHPEIPSRSGTIPDIQNYDSGYFGIHERQAYSLDPVLSLLQENTVSAIFDAGLQPSNLQNTKTGVYVSSIYSENAQQFFYNKLEPDVYVMTGSMRSMIAHRLSYFLKLNGPSHNIDTACSSSLYSLEHAYRALRLGEIDNAIVAGVNLCLHPINTLQFARLGVLSKDGACKVFDALGNGYVRSEAIGVILLQKAKHAKRMYCEVVHVKSNCDGYKEEGITFPSKVAQSEMLVEFYDECNIDRHSLSFLETHGTGTPVGDPQECSTIDDVLLRERTAPLLIGSVKSNIGHTEPAAAVCSIIKCIIGMETGYIPPNIHYNVPRPELKGLVEGRMKVVTEKMPFEDDRGLIGINSFGFGGGNCHALLRWNKKVKVNSGTGEDDLPRLVCVSGRTERCVTSLLNSVTTNKFDVEYITLLQSSFRNNVQNHQCRGYTIRSRSGEIARSTNLLKHFASESKPLCIVFGELNNWYEIGCDLIILPEFFSSVQRIQNILVEKVNILDLFFKKSFNMKIGYVLGNVVVQFGLLGILDKLEINPTGKIMAYSIGELISAYYKGTLSLEDTINYAFYIDQSILEVNNNCEDTETIEDKCITSNSSSIDSSTSNADTNNENQVNTLSNLRTTLKNNNFPWIEDTVLQNLNKELSNEDSDKLKVFLQVILNNVVSNDKIPPNAIIIKVDDRKFNESEDTSYVNLFSDARNYLLGLLKGLGRLYELGYNPQISNMYPSVKFPVSRDTEMISPYIMWNHRKPKYIPQFNLQNGRQTHGYRTVNIEVDSHEWKYIKGHVIDGRNLFPATGYLYLVWETFSFMNNMPITEMEICFENCKFIKAVAVPKSGNLSLHINIQWKSGSFEVFERDAAVVTGRILLLHRNTVNAELNLHYEYKYNHTDMKLKVKDIYKELKLRGYDYKGEFRAIQKCSVNATNSLINWGNKWVTFMDNMLQTKILQLDSRLLFVPTFISKLQILAKQHLKVVTEQLTKENQTPVLPVVNDEITGKISCGGISIWDLAASSIQRRKILNVPVLENYKFIPNFTDIDINQSVRVNMQIILENALTYKVKAVELIDEYTKKNTTPLTFMIQSALEDQPLVQPLLKILSKMPIKDTTIEIEDKTLNTETDCLLVIASNVIDRPDVMEKACASLVENGFLIARESHQYDNSKNVGNKFTVFTAHRTSNETILLLKKQTKVNKCEYIKISCTKDFSWVSKVQNTLIKEGNEDVVLYVENEPKSGILGLFNCLKRELQSKSIRCVFLMNKVEDFDPHVPFYSTQLKKHMAVNVYKNGQWGTYRHVLLSQDNKVESEHCFANISARGDLSSLRWYEGPLRLDMKNKTIISVYYGALNFRDIMTALGKINVDVITRYRLAQECVQGIEFSGRDSKGNRVMGIIPFGALSTLIENDMYLTFPVPNNWSLEEAATVPVVYSTVIYALVMRGKMRGGESILIHSGTGGIGQAAIRFALYYGCKVFTTVGTKDKRNFLKKTFPQLKDHHIGNSRDESFEQLILTGTNGRGVDIVLNSLAEEKLITSVRCLAKGGRFIEIGKFDLAQNHELNCLLFQKEATFQGVMLDQLIQDQSGIKEKLGEIIMEGIKCGAVKPLNVTVFKYNELEQAFRFMATGKHMGKILIQLRKPEMKLVVPPNSTKFLGNARYFCDPEKVYIIVGGLGGFGLELADWLILRGAKMLVLTSRKGVTTGYQSYRLSIWETYGVIVKVSTVPITTRKGCKQLIEESLQLGPIDAIFNLAVVLVDSIFENQTPETFITSFGPKAYATQYLDEFTRKMCPNLTNFVVFSSVSCGRGNAGQTNYGMSNSVMERICENRKQEGFPALAIEWGAIGEVGLVAEMLEEDIEIEISGTLQQRVSSCLQVLDIFLKQKEACVVSSIVVAEKRALPTADNVVDAVINILGLHDSKSISLHYTLAELGMDSIAAVEIKQVLERDFEVFLSAKDMRNMTLSKLKDIQSENLCENDKQKGLAHFGIEMVVRLIGATVNTSDPYVQMASKGDQSSNGPILLLFPGIEGFANIYRGFTENLNMRTIGIQLNLENVPKSILELSLSILPTVENLIPHNVFTFVAYSFGTVIALETVKILESRGYKGTLICIDGAPMLAKNMLLNLDIGSERIFETTLLCHMLSFYISFKEITKHKENIFECTNWDERVNLGIGIIKHHFSHEADYLRLVANNIFYRCRALMDYTPSYSKLKTNIKLIKPTQCSIAGLPEDYELSQYLENPPEIHTLEGNHSTILENKALADLINSYVNPL